LKKRNPAGSTFKPEKNPAKKFLARKKGVSLPAATRIVIRAADVQLTPGFFHRREFPAVIAHFQENAGPLGSAQIFCRKKVWEFFFQPEKRSAPYPHVDRFPIC